MKNISYKVIILFLLIFGFGSFISAQTISGTPKWQWITGNYIEPIKSNGSYATPSSTAYCLGGSCLSAWPSGTSPLTTKGDIYVYSTSSDDRLPVGTNGYVLSANSNTGTGLEWIANAGGGSSNWATTSSDFWETQQWRWSTSSADYWETQQAARGGGSGSWATTSEDFYWGVNFPINFASSYNATTTLNGFTNNQSDWNTAFGWGNHATAGYLPSSSYYATTTWAGGNNNLNVTGYASTTAGLFTQGNLHIGGNTTLDGTLTIGAYTLPNTDGTSGYVLKTNGSGTVTWQAESGGGGSGYTPWYTDGSGYLTATSSNFLLTGNLTTTGFGQFNNVTTTDTLSTGGRLGVNTGTFLDVLTVNPSGSTGGIVVTESDSSTNMAVRILADTNSGSINLRENSTDKVQFSAGNTDTNFINNGGKFGLGTASPTTDFEVRGSGAATSTIASGNATVLSGETLGTLNFNSNDGSTLVAGPVAQIVAVAESDHTGSPVARTGLQFFTRNTQLYPAEAMRINYLGYVGIGDTTPAALFTVGNGDLFQVATDGDLTLGSGADYLVGSAGNSKYAFRYGSAPNTGIYFNTSNNKIEILNTSATSQLSVAAVPGADSWFTDSLGIGDTTPDGKLEVRQTAAADIFNLYDNTTNVFTVLDGGNVGIGDTTPASLFTVGNGDLFQINSSGAVKAQAGIPDMINFEIQQGKVGHLTTSPSPAAIDGSQKRWYALMDASTDECADFQTIMPRTYSSNMTLKADITFGMASATTGNVINYIQIMATTGGDSADLETDSFATANTTATTAVAGTAGYMKIITTTLSNADSVAAGDLVTFRVCRDADNASDTATGDQEISGFTIYWD